MDAATNTRLAALDARLREIYRAAAETALKNKGKALAKLVSFDPAEYPDLKSAQLEAKRKSYARMVDRAEKISDGIARDIANSAEIARKMIDGERLNVFEIGYRHSLDSVDGQLGFDVDWAIYDRNTLRAILDDTPKMVKKNDVEVSTESFGQVGAREVYDRRQRQYIRERAYGRLGDSKGIVQRLQHQLSAAVINGEGIPKIATRIRQVTDMSRRQAVTIARTETLRAANQGRNLGYAQAYDDYGIEMSKRWVSTFDDRTREDHMEMMGVTVDFDAPFIVGGEEMMFPLDPNASAAQVVNCRCAHVAVLKGYSFSEKNALRDRAVREGWLKEGGRRAQAAIKDSQRHEIDAINGMVTSNGIAISRPSIHFMERAAERGVVLSSIKEALQNPLNIGTIRTDKITGNRSQSFIGRNGTVTINPDTGRLITTYATGSQRLKKYGGDGN